MMAMLADVPPMLAAAWAAWFVLGGALAFWYRRATELEYAPVQLPKPIARPKPALRQPSGVRSEDPMPGEFAPADLDDTAHLYQPPPAAAAVTAREKKPVVIGDPFGDLATLLDQPVVAAAAPTPMPYASRTPAESPILSSAGAPLLRNTDREPKLS